MSQKTFIMSLNCKDDAMTINVSIQDGTIILKSISNHSHIDEDNIIELHIEEWVDIHNRLKRMGLLNVAS